MRRSNLADAAAYLEAVVTVRRKAIDAITIIDTATEPGIAKQAARDARRWLNELAGLADSARACVDKDAALERAKLQLATRSAVPRDEGDA